MDRPAILYVTGPSLSCDAGLARAVRLARRSGASLTLLHLYRSERAPATTETSLAFDCLAHRATQEGILVETHFVGHRTSWREALAHWDWSLWDVVVKVPEFRVPTGPLGRSVDRVLARAPLAPVWFVSPSLGAETKVVVAAIDVERPGLAALNAQVALTAAAFASSAGARLYLVHAWSLVGESIVTCPVRGLGRSRGAAVVRELQRHCMDRLNALAALTEYGDVTPLIVRGTTDRALRGAARTVGADLLVLGTVGRVGLAGAFLGNRAERFVGRNGLGVLIVKDGGRVPQVLRSAVAA